MKYLLIDVDSGDFEVDKDEDAGDERLRARRLSGNFYLMRADGGPAGQLGFSWF
jgi:hypothetical protein